MLPKMNHDDLASPPPFAATFWLPGSVECPRDPTRFLRGTQASVRLQERHGTPDQKTGTPRRSQVPCSVVCALPWSRRSGTIRTKPLRLAWRFSHRPLSDLLFVQCAHDQQCVLGCRLTTWHRYPASLREKI